MNNTPQNDRNPEDEVFEMIDAQGHGPLSEEERDELIRERKELEEEERILQQTYEQRMQEVWIEQALKRYEEDHKIWFKGAMTGEEATRWN